MSEGATRRAGSFVLVLPLAKGARSTIHLGRSAGSAPRGPVAVKIYDPPPGPRELERARLLTAFDHPRWARIFEVHTESARTFSVLGLVPGWPLSRILESRGALPFEDAARLAGGALVALDALHALRDPLEPSRPMLHGRLTPAKILFAPDGIVRLIGLDRAASNDPILGYAAPEQLVGGEVDPRADLWTLAAIIFELCTGKPYIPRGAAQQMKLETLDPPPIDSAKFPPRAIAILKTALDPDPGRRFSSARDLLAALNELQPGVAKPHGDPPALAGEALWTEREATRTRFARSESLQDFHLPNETYEEWDRTASADYGGEPEPPPTALNAALRSRSAVTDPGAPPARTPPPQPVLPPAPDAAVARPPEPRVLLIVAAVMSFVLIVLAGILGGRLLHKWNGDPQLAVTPIEEPPELPPVEATVVPEEPRDEPAPDAGIVAAQIDSAPPVAPPVAPLEERRPRPPRPQRPPDAGPRVAPPPPAPVQDAAQDEAQAQAEIRRLIGRARALKAEHASDPARTGQIDRLLGRLVVEASARSPQGRSARLAELKRELEALEAR